MSTLSNSIAAIIPAAGVGKRMQANCPKQYLTINNTTILAHTVTRLLSYPAISKVVVVISAEDEYFAQTELDKNPKVITVLGGKERVDSVLAGIKAVANSVDWVMVHDAARPCVTIEDIDRLVHYCLSHQQGGLLAVPVSDTIKLADKHLAVDKTIDRNKLWRAYTPQMYPVAQLITAIERGLAQQLVITDESSAIEAAGFASQLIEGRSDNIKITRPDDFAIAAFILNKQQQELTCE